MLCYIINLSKKHGKTRAAQLAPMYSINHFVCMFFVWYTQVIYILAGLWVILPVCQSPCLFTFQSHWFSFINSLFPSCWQLRQQHVLRVDMADIMTCWQKHKKMFRCGLDGNLQCLRSPCLASWRHLSKGTYWQFFLYLRVCIPFNISSI